jgi:hypothetical protein
LNLKRRRQEKRARRVVTRPEPTIYGNCDSWSFIVGKKGVPYSPKNRKFPSLRRHNMNLSTAYQQIDLGRFEQVVGDLWIGTHAHRRIPHRGFRAKLYARNRPWADAYSNQIALSEQ